jgi:hypothetical protein
MEIIIILFAIIIISLFVPIETFLVDDIKHILDTDPPCLLTDKMVKRLGNNYCSILSEKVCNKCGHLCKWDKTCKKLDSTDSCNNTCSSTCKSDNGWDLTESVCTKCENCGWCIDDDYDGTCVKPDPDGSRPSKCTRGWEYQCVDYGPSGDIPNTKTCYMGINEKQPLKNEYATIGCNLYNFYEDCLKCKDLGKCSVYYADGTVKCEDCKGKTPNCLASPTAGFGCPGKDFTSDNIPPINPLDNDGVVCQYTI